MFTRDAWAVKRALGGFDLNEPRNVVLVHERVEADRRRARLLRVWKVAIAVEKARTCKTTNNFELLTDERTGHASLLELFDYRHLRRVMARGQERSNN